MWRLRLGAFASPCEFSLQSDAPLDKRIARARKLVIDSAGGYSTPLILERYGAGDALALYRAGR